MTTITLKKLHTEGRLSISDTLHHSENGDHELIRVRADGSIIVKDQCGRYFNWTIDFGGDAKLVQVNSGGVKQ